MPRDFLIQRYCLDNHPRVRGLRPFIATGPGFKRWTAHDSIARFGEWRFAPGLREAIEAVFPAATTHPAPESRLVIAEFLLKEGIVQALWSVDSAECLPRDRWLGVSIDEVAAEIPYVVVDGTYDLALWTIEDLCSMPDPSHFREYVSADGLDLEPFVYV